MNPDLELSPPKDENKENKENATELEKEKENSEDKEKEDISQKEKELEKKSIKEQELEKEIDIENISSISVGSNIYSNLSTTEEIIMSFDKSKIELSQVLSRDIYRCHLCKELMTTKMKVEGDFINIEYTCPNSHFGSLDISLFISKISYYSLIYSKCSKCGKQQLYSSEIFYFCKDCEEIYCPNHIKECNLCKENVVSLNDLDYLCTLHKKDYISYCEECNENLCENCVELEVHKNHKKYFFKDKIIEKEENNNIDKFIQDSKTTKNNFEREIERIINKYNKEKLEDIIINMKSDLNEKLHIYGDMIFYAFCIKKAYDFCVSCNRYNHQILTNLYELVKDQLIFIEQKFKEINQFILKLNKNIFFFPLQNDSTSAIPNKKGIKIKDQIIKNSNNNIKMVPAAINNNSNSENKKIVIKKYIFEDGEYEGEIKEGLPHGKGSYKYKNGDEYVGEFKNGYFDGNGEHTTKKGEKYSGQFKKGKREGNGICKRLNGEEYCGYWKDNKKDGKGKYIFSNGDFYQGEFKEDMFHGQGTLFYSSGNKTIGTWKNNKRNGIEFLFNSKGEIFLHIYENNTLIQEKKLEINTSFRDFNNEKIIEEMTNFYHKQVKKK